MLARSIAASIDGTFSRVQATPDLLPSDLTGISVYDQEAKQFRFVPGPSSPTWSWWTRSTGPRRGPSRRSWRRWRSGRSPWRMSPTRSPSPTS
ncbi:MAG TPA: AAA family ATPase [Actinomycetota bacterium]